MVVDVVRLYELFLPKHTLVLYLGARPVDWDTCLGFYDLEQGHVFRLSTIGLAHEMALQTVSFPIDIFYIYIYEHVKVKRNTSTF